MKKNNCSKSIVANNIQEIKQMYYDDGIGLYKISKKFGISESSLRDNMIKLKMQLRAKNNGGQKDCVVYKVLNDKEMEQEMKTILFPNGFKNI